MITSVSSTIRNGL